MGKGVIMKNMYMLKVETLFPEEKPEKEKYFKPQGDILVAYNGHVSDGCCFRGWLFGATYVVTDTYDRERDVVLRRVYGDVPQGAVLTEELLEKVHKENEAAIMAAENEYGGDDFRWQLHKLLHMNAKTVLAKTEIISGRYRSAWGEGYKGIYCKPILPEGRISAPLRIVPCEWEEGKWELGLWLDTDHPAARMRCYNAWVGSNSHGCNTIVVVRENDGKGFDLGRSDWPKDLPRTFETFMKVIDVLGREQDCCGNYVRLEEEAIRKAIYKR